MKYLPIVVIASIATIHSRIDPIHFGHYRMYSMDWAGFQARCFVDPQAVHLQFKKMALTFNDFAQIIRI